MHCWELSYKIKRKINELPIFDEEKRLLDLLNESDESELEFLKLDEFESSEWITSNSDDNDCDCDHYKVIINLNGLSINMITVQESILLDLIDSKKMSREVWHEKFSQLVKKLKLKMKVVVDPIYNERRFRPYEKGKPLVYSRF